LAKFTSNKDTKAVERAEVATLRLASLCGLDVPDVELFDNPKGYPVAIISRFDRFEKARIPYISAQTMLDRPTADNGTYAEIAEAIRVHGADPKADLLSLFQRILFSILVSNVDDHLKNHAFLYAGRKRWRLSPIFDVNPFPERFKQLKTAIADPSDNAASIEQLLEYAFYFEIDKVEALKIISTMAETVKGAWKGFCLEAGMSRDEITEYTPAFEHQETEFALNLKKTRMFI